MSHSEIGVWDPLSPSRSLIHRRGDIYVLSRQRRNFSERLSLICRSHCALAPVVHVNSQVIFDTASDRENTMSGTIPPLVTRFESVAPSRHHHRLDTLKPGGASLV